MVPPWASPQPHAPAAAAVLAGAQPDGECLGYLRQNQLSLRVWPDYPAIVATCCKAWNALMAMPERLASITRREWAKPVTS